MGRLELLGRRLVKAMILIFAIAVVNFLLIRMAPGDPAAVMAGEAGAADEKFVAQLRQEFGLDRPFPVQLWRYVSGVATLDLGYSYRNKRSVASMVFERLPATLLLTVTAFLFALGAGVALGAVAATFVGRWVDTVATVLSLTFYATPIFWIGLMGILLFSIQLDWLPAFGMETVGGHFTGVTRLLDIAAHLVLPALTLGLFYVAIYARLTRAAMLEVQTQDFVKTAKAKGLPSGRIVRAHILRNAILPVITLAGIQAGQLIGGSILVETVFAWPGIGRLAFEALLQRDYQTLLGVFLLTSVMVVLFNLITDFIYTMVDPRIEVGR
jgi:peptide/nickel transport system permease protein